MVIDKNSWHYKWLAYSSVMMNYIHYRRFIEDMLEDGKSYREIYDGAYWRFNISMPNNFCQYWRRVLFTHPMILIINILIFIIAVGLSSNFPGTAAIVAGGIIGAIMIVAGVFGVLYGIDTLRERAKNVTQSNENNLVAQAYKSYKSNVCTLVEYKE